MHHRHEAWRNIDAQLVSEEDRLSTDERIHCVLYFISPHRMKDIDKEFLLQLADVVPIVPILSKADAMTTDELFEHVQSVSSAISNLSTSSGESLCYEFFNNSSRTQDPIQSSVGQKPCAAGVVEAPMTTPTTASAIDEEKPTLNLETMIGLEKFEDFESVDSNSSLSTDATQASSTITDFFSFGIQLKDEKAIVEATATPVHVLEHLDTSPTQGIFPSTAKVSESLCNAEHRRSNVFAVVSSLSHSRIYLWGKVDIDDERISDFRRLQRLIFEEGVHQSQNQKFQLHLISLDSH